MLPVTHSLLPTFSKFFDEDWNSLFDRPAHNVSSTYSSLPAVNVIEGNDRFTVEVAAPGMRKEDFQIELKDNVLTIKSEFRRENEEEDIQKFVRKEFSYQAFQRSFQLNHQVVDDGNILATYTDGVLRITLAKKEEAKARPPRLIEIS